jgi:hypothetical protein
MNGQKSKMELDNLQKLFYEAIFATDENSQEKLSQYIKSPHNLNAEEGFNIYHGSIFGQLAKTLANIYPVCCQLVGEEFFQKMATFYIRHHPSISPDLNSYGADFPSFLANFEPVQPLVYLPDVALLEWYYHQVFQGEDTEKLNLQALNEVSPEQWEHLIFHLPINSFLLESAYPIHRIWEVNQPDYQGEEEVSLEEGGIKIFLWRENYDLRLDFPTLQEWKLLNAFARKESLGKVIESYATIFNHDESLDLNSLLSLFVQRGWIVDFSVE